VAGYDVGSRVAQTLARLAPSRIRGLVLCNPSYPGIGNRRLEYAAQSQFWYQHFHNTAIADAVIGHNRETVKIYIGHFYDHWVGRKDSLRPAELEAIVDTYVAPKLHEAVGNETPAALTISQPTRVLWGECDPIFPPAWSDKLTDYFPDMALKMLPDVGHFVPFEAPEDVVDAIEQLR
jgi:pimeloyl-ACP methyl ester carboxylesterase